MAWVHCLCSSHKQDAATPFPWCKHILQPNLTGAAPQAPCNESGCYAMDYATLTPSSGIHCVICPLRVTVKHLVLPAPIVILQQPCQWLQGRLLPVACLQATGSPHPACRKHTIRAHGPHHSNNQPACLFTHTNRHLPTTNRTNSCRWQQTRSEA